MFDNLKDVFVKCVGVFLLITNLHADFLEQPDESQNQIFVRVGSGIFCLMSKRLNALSLFAYISVGVYSYYISCAITCLVY